MLLGRYEHASRAALDGLECGVTTEKLTQKLLTRHAKSCFFMAQYSEATDALRKISSALGTELEGMLAVAVAEVEAAEAAGHHAELMVGRSTVPGVCVADNTSSIHAACRPPAEEHIDEFWIFGQHTLHTLHI